MARIRLAVAALLVSVMIGTASIVAVAQDAATEPEGPNWQLTQYTVDGALVAVPDDVPASLLLENGQAGGSAGCNTFFGSYQIDGQAITFGEDFGSTKRFCGGDAQVVEAAYLATLPTMTGWAISDGALSLSDAAGAIGLVYGSTMDEVAPTDIDRILALLESMQAQVGSLEARLVALEGDGAASPDSPGGPATVVGKLTAPKAPKAKGGKVTTKFPDWMRDEFRPESERSDDKNRELVQWTKGKGGAAEGFRVYARRGFCALKPGVDASQALDPDKDFTTKTGKAVLIDELAAGTKRYRPKHDDINATLAAAPESPYSNDQYYDLLVSAYNAKGESARTKVGSFYLTPEFSCP